MRYAIIKDLLILAILATGGFFVIHYWVGKQENLPEKFSFSISVEEEEEIGALLVTNFKNGLDPLQNPTVDSALNIITQTLLAQLENSPYHYSFTILDHDEINAFTLPGGNIFIFSGLIENAGSAEEVAAVLAHEIGHAEKRHVIDRLVKELSLTVVTGILSGGDPNLLVQIIQTVIGTKFDREQEEEADLFGMRLLEKSKIDPKSLAKFFTRLNDQDLTFNPALEFLMTHPHNDKRIQKATAYNVSPDFVPVPLPVDWDKIKNWRNSNEIEEEGED